MYSPSPTDMLQTWDRGLHCAPVERGLLLLTLAAPQIPEGDLARLTVGERDRRLLTLRAALFGARLTGLVSCAACGEALELKCGTADLLAPAAGAGVPVLWVEDYELELRLPDSHDLLAAAAARPGAAARLLFSRCVVRAARDGEPVAVDCLPDALIEAAGDALSRTDPLADLHFAMTCVACGAAWQAPLDTPAFVWLELNAWAERMLAEVHRLAAAYGWTEDEILRLSAARRGRYLDMVAG